MKLHPRVVHCRSREPYSVYVGRGRCPRTGAAGRFGNPFSVERYGTRALVMFLDMLAGLEPEHLAFLRCQLAGEVLGCWCRGRYPVCHGDVLARLADGEELSIIRSDVLRALGIAA